MDIKWTKASIGGQTYKSAFFQALFVPQSHLWIEFIGTLFGLTVEFVIFELIFFVMMKIKLPYHLSHSSDEKIIADLNHSLRNSRAVFSVIPQI